MLYFFLAFLLSVAGTFLVRIVATRLSIVDRPDNGRKKHVATVPLLGGVAIFCSFWLVVGYLVLFHPILGLEILQFKLWWVFLASILLILLGAVDDISGLPVGVRLAVTALAATVALGGGLGLEKITNPLGGFIALPNVIGLSLVFVWLMVMMYTTKISDGLDGLATGIVAIGAIMIAIFSGSASFFQPNVSLLAIIFAGSCLGFLIFNFSPASIFLGEGGSLFVGFMLGVLAVVSGGKLATALLVMAIPMFDLGRVILARLRRGQSVFEGDREHLYFQLQDRGVPTRRIVIGLYVFSALLGSSTLFLQSGQKLFFVAVLFVCMFVAAKYFTKKSVRL